MDDYDDLQVEEFSNFDFVEEMNENLFDDDDKEDKTFNSFLNSNTDNWLWLKKFLGQLNWILQQTNDLKNLRVKVLR